MNELALFAGAGGGLLATKWLLGFKVVCYVENAPYPVEVLKARIRDGFLNDAPIWGDARTFDGRPWRGCVDIVTAGFPCQPFSQAGKGLAEQDDRNLWPDTIRIIREIRPRWVLLENVPRLLSHAYVRRIFGDLAQGGYDCRWDCIPASAIGANHQRDRLWVVAYANSGRFPKYAQLNRQSQDNTTFGDQWGGYVGGCGDEVANASKSRLEGAARAGMPRTQGADVEFACCGETVAYTNSEGLLQQRTDRGGSPQSSVESRRHWRRWWEVEPDVGRMVDGLPRRVDRLKALGNAQVPAVVAVVWQLLAPVR